MGKAIMIMGTASGVGKSTVVTGLCRLLTKMGHRAAPFKAQNISNKIHILPDGKRIARSSALAAAACNLGPHTDMNPVLITPSGKAGVEIVLNGKAMGEKRFDEVRGGLFDQAFYAYERLLQNHDIVVAEGAGSPVELNLVDKDIVNMNFAARAKIPVLLTGEINRGGVFASVYGTLALLPKEQRALVKGIIINKFMGDPGLFEDGKNIMERITGLPVIGVLPYMRIELEDEDSFAEGTPKTKESLYASLDSRQNDSALVDSAIENLACQMKKYLNPALLVEIINGGA